MSDYIGDVKLCPRCNAREILPGATVCEACKAELAGDNGDWQAAYTREIAERLAAVREAARSSAYDAGRAQGSYTSAPNYLTEKDEADLRNRFVYHPPKDGQNQRERYEALRGQAHDLARQICALCPPSRERSVALTELETAVMWANAAIARNE